MKYRLLLPLLAFTSLSFGKTYESYRSDSWDKAFTQVSDTPKEYDVYNIKHHVRLTSPHETAGETHLKVMGGGRLLFNNTTLTMNEKSSIEVFQGGKIMGVDGNNADANTNNSKSDIIYIGQCSWSIRTQIIHYPDTYYRLDCNLDTYPVTLISFTANNNHNGIEFRWDVASEIGLSHYLVQMSEDGQVFNTVGTVLGTGNSATRKSYRYLYTTPTHGVNQVLYFRLKSVDLDGSSEIHGVKAVSVMKPGSLFRLEGGVIRIANQVNGLTIVGMDGKVIKSLKNQQVVDVGHLKGGYVIIVTSGKEVQRMKFISI